MHKRIEPSFFLTGTIGADHGEWLGSMTSTAISFSHWSSMSLLVGSGILLGFSRIGVSSYNSIRCGGRLAPQISSSLVLRTFFFRSSISRTLFFSSSLFKSQSIISLNVSLVSSWFSCDSISIILYV